MRHRTSNHCFPSAQRSTRLKSSAGHLEAMEVAALMAMAQGQRINLRPPDGYAAGAVTFVYDL